MKLQTTISKEQGKRLLRAATQLSKITGQKPEQSLLTIVKSVAGHIRTIRNK